MRVFWVLRAKTLLFGLMAAFMLLLILYSWNTAAQTVFPWGRNNVYFMGHSIDPKEPGLEELVRELTAGLDQPPLSAAYDEVNEAVIPEINGFEIVLDETVERIKSARKGSTVTPVWRETAPEQRIGDFAELPIYAGNPIRNQVALVVNVSWGNEYLLEMLDIFAEEAVNASFFLVGRWAEENPDLVTMLVEAGHELGNHGYSDPHMKDLSTEAIQEEIRRTNEIITEMTGGIPQWFSPPYGEKESKIFATAADMDMHTVLWSLDTIDWTLPGEDQIVSRILDNMHHGAIVLMHPTEQTPGALRRIIAGIKQKDLELVTVGQILDPTYWPAKYSILWTGH
ncbi:MAG: hypothetical protein FH749_03175 [Firmicutes bacterium]|nr:hypothetical protein [Bacillota bacterium]